MTETPEPLRLKTGATLRLLYDLGEPAADIGIASDALVMASRARVSLDVRIVGEDFRHAEVSATADETADWPPFRHVQVDLREVMADGDITISPTITILTDERITAHD
jgi:hypothetical protein